MATNNINPSSVNDSKPFEMEIVGNRVNDPIGPQDYNFKKLKLKTSVGELDIKTLLVDFSFFEDIFSFSISGYLTVRDAAGYIELLKINGQETIEIQLSKFEDDINDIHRTLRVYKIDPRHPSGNMTSEYYTLHFCSEELILSEQNKISKDFGGPKKISDMVSLILFDEIQGLKSNRAKKNWNIEETSGVYEFPLSYMKPFEAISFLCNYAKPKDGVGADMLFFENNDGFNFRSLQSMYKQEPYSTYKYQAKNIKKDDKSEEFSDKWESILSYEMVKPFDVLNDISSGTYANRLITVDPLTRSHKVTDFNYSKYSDQTNTMNKEETISEAFNRLGQSLFDSPLAKLGLAISNADHENIEYIKEKVAAVKDIFSEIIGTNRIAQLNLANYTVLKIVVPGDPALTVGKTIHVSLPSLQQAADKNQVLEDQYYSGKYLITAARHMVQHDSYQTVLEISKESSIGKYISSKVSE